MHTKKVWNLLLLIGFLCLSAITFVYSYDGINQTVYEDPDRTLMVISENPFVGDGGYLNETSLSTTSLSTTSLSTTSLSTTSSSLTSSPTSSIPSTYFLSTLSSDYLEAQTASNGAGFNISGYKINHFDNTGLPGWNITITNDTMQTSTLTDSNGFYEFTNIINGTYTIFEEQRSDWMNVSPVSMDITISGKDELNVNFTNSPLLIISDDFSAPTLNTSLWTEIDPQNDATFTISGTGTSDALLSISIPAGTSHDVWGGDNLAPRIMQSVSDTDFEIEVKFESQLTSKYQMQGVIIQQNDSNFLRFDIFTDGTKIRIFAASFSGGSSTPESDITISPGNPLYLKVKRQGDQWTQYYSYDGSSWTTAANFNHALTVTSLGPFIGNAGSSPPAFTGLIDYFFNSASPIIPEDPGDTNPPYIIDNTPTGTDVPVETAITVTFNKSMNTTSAENAFSISPLVTGTFSWSGDILTFTPDADLDYSTTYEVTIGTGAEDLSGNPLTTAYVWDFTTAAEPDNTPPTVTVNEPIGTDVPVSTQIHVTFSEAMNQTSAESAFSTFPVTTGGFTWNGSIMTYTPNVNLTFDTTYTVTIGTGTMDLVDNNMLTEHTWEFTTESENIPPTITDNTPTGTNVPVSTLINVTFSEAMNQTSGESAFSTSPATSGSFTWNGNIMTYTPDPDLTYNTTYTVTIGTGAMDLADNFMELPHIWEFMTATSDIIPPTVTVNEPTGIEVPVSSQINVTFSEAMNQTSAESAFSTFPATTGLFTWNGNIMTYTPDMDLDYITTYTVTINTDAMDLANNSLQTDHTWQFTTGFIIISDDFNAPALNTSIWKIIDPVGDAQFTIVGNGTPNALLTITVPAGTSHDVWDGGNYAPRIMQTANNSDFEIELKFQSEMTSEYQIQGLIVEQDINNYLRFDFVRSSVTTTKAFAASFTGGSPTVRYNVDITPGNPLYMRINRTGNQWKQSYSYDGTDWISAANFNHTIAVTSIGPFIGNAGNSPPAFTGQIDYFFNTSSPIIPEDELDTNPPNIFLWYGNSQSFGHIGVPQQWVNILGNVQDESVVASMNYSLNNGSVQNLSIGPASRRLQSVGDFNIEINHTDLVCGDNQIVINATDTFGNTQRETISVNYTCNTIWPENYTIDWSNEANIFDVAQIVDGLWIKETDSVSPVIIGYDRLIAVGDMTWDDYEITVPITINEPLDSSLPWGPNFGITMRWQGHHDRTEQPRDGWWPLGALGVYIWVPQLNDYRLRIIGNNMAVIANDTSGKHLEVGVPYLFKMRAQTNGTITRYSLKVWEQNTTEPAEWTISGNGVTGELKHGSAMLISHYSNVSFGNVNIKAPPFDYPLFPSISDVSVEAYAYNATVHWITNKPASGNVSY